MDIDLVAIEAMVEAYTLSLPRVYLVFTILPMLSKRFVGGALVHNGILLSLCLFIYPLTEGTLPLNLEKFDLVAILLKEALVGLVIGFAVAIPFWVAEGVGFVVDNQRGSTMASAVNPLSGDETSPLGIFLSQLLNTFFILSGAFLIMLSVIYQSYVYWPVGKMLPVELAGLDIYLLGQLDFIMRSIVLFSAPIVIAMFLAEFTLALISRFAPQLNVFFLAMPIKSAVGIFLMVIYIKLLMGHIDALVNSTFNDMRYFMENLLSTLV